MATTPKPMTGDGDEINDLAAMQRSAEKSGSGIHVEVIYLNIVASMAAAVHSRTMQSSTIEKQLKTSSEK